ncbi:NADP-dependent oxidoreductase [Glacieibacterium frigidum]|uniref:Zinc-binding dehydrogenase n=1 Tax=Glacieibacterium frigidum TaxID=2593303 RepID=A0A552U8B8_9SPHN|nr:zinc-binding dehydrogenase [Glacieibacterium frigidum]TRW14465.1 zinc-binding dehydrogenase [Glacieibacterium frigidum]
MSTLQNQRVVLASSPDGELKPSDFGLETDAMPVPGKGELLLETIFLSIDPYMRFWMRSEKSYNNPIKPGDLIVGATVSRVRQSQNPGWHEGEWVLAFSGWQRFAISNGSGLRRIDPAIAPPSTAVGILGMTGFTAYAGLRNVGRPKPGETVVVAAASGAVGSAVGQIARIQGARAVGITTGAQKLAYVKDELGFNAVIDYKAPDFAARLTDAVPDGIDVYFELVGGPIWDAVLPLLNTYARVPVVGLIADYEARAGEQAAPDRLANTMGQIMGKSLTLRGFIQTEFADEQLGDFLREAGTWFADGRLRHREHIVEGLENAPDALIAQLKGGNFGKMLVKVGES